MKVLSLFDGISCGMVALERAGFSVEEYAAFEIDKYALKVSGRNYPQIRQCGDVFDGDFTVFRGFDLLIGGSPCTHWSIARNNRETTPDGIGFELFMQYKRALDESGCKFFLFENNYSIHSDIKAAISKALGVEPIVVNSALVSAQQRKRCYWTNIPKVTQPKDRGILLQDILEQGVTDRVKAHCLTNHAGNARDYFKKGHTQVVFQAVCVAQRGRYTGPSGCIEQRYEPKLDGKTNTLTTVGKDNLILQPIRIGQYGKGGQGQRIYSVAGKAVNITANGGGQGGKTGLYKIDLPDGDYIIRPLAPVEAERLQTLPDNYTAGISATQRVRALGNGWTVDVIAHILSFMPK